LKFSSIQSIVQLAVGTMLLALAMRTWLVMGLIEPVTVSGSSMAPTLDDGDYLRIDRTQFVRRRPTRGEVVVARNPHDGTQLCVKRIAGMPGEVIEIRQGDVWINRHPCAKTLEQQRAVRQLVHSERGRTLRWHAMDSNLWRWREDAWRVNSDQMDQMHWLNYVHPGDQPVTDDVESNLGLSRQLNLVCDFALSVKLSTRGSGQLALKLNDGRQTIRVGLILPTGELSLSSDGQLLHKSAISKESLRKLSRGSVRLELSNFDRRLQLAIGSRVELSHPLTSTSPPRGTSRPISIGVAGLQVALGDLNVYRDIYYLQQTMGEAHAAKTAILRLGHDEYYLLGDNSPISIDSRIWGGVGNRMLLGKPLGVR